MPIDNPSVIQARPDFIGMEAETQLNQFILTIDSRAAKISIPKPKFKKTMIAVLKRNEKTGEPELNADGTNILLEGEIEEFDGWREELIDFPVPDVFNNDLAKSYILDSEVYFIRVAQHSYAYFLQEYFHTKDEGYLSLLNLTATLVNSCTTTAGSRHGFRMITAKTKISKTQGEEIAKIQAEEEIKNKGFMGRLWPFGPKAK